MDPNSAKRWSNLEEQFFKGVDHQLLGKLREQMEQEQSAEAIMRLTSIGDKALAERIAGLKVAPETLAAFCLVPLVAVAWANDNVDADEKYVIDRAAKSAGLDDNCLKLLSGWLAARPGSELFDTWCQYAKVLAMSMTETERVAMQKHVVSQATAVAKASGGVLGIGAISPNEKSVLDKISGALA